MSGGQLARGADSDRGARIEVDAGCCGNACGRKLLTRSACPGSFSVQWADVEITKKEAGCDSYKSDTEQCYCGWEYGGAETEANNCTSTGGGTQQVWNCRAAVDYETNGRCQSNFECSTFTGQTSACAFAPLADPAQTTPPPSASLPSVAVRLGGVCGVSALLAGIAASFAMLY